MPSTPETSSSESENDKYPTFKCCDVQCLKHYTNWSQNDIYKVVDVPSQTGHDMLSACTGRPHLISHKKMQEIIDFITEHYSSHILKWQNLAEKCNVKISARTVKQKMKLTDYHKCKICQKDFISSENAQKHLAFAKNCQL